MTKTFKQEIIKMMSKKTGATLPEVIAKNINANTARRVLAAEAVKTISRKCRVTGNYRAAYCV